MKAQLILASLIGLNLAACGQQETTERAKVGGVAFQTPAADGLPKINLVPYEQFALTSSASHKSTKKTAQANDAQTPTKADNQALQDLMVKAKEELDDAFGSSNNVLVTGVSYATGTWQRLQSCTIVQIQQQDSKGKITVLDQLVPAGQPETCTVEPGNLNVAAMAIIARVWGNWVAGVGVGAIAYIDPYIAGCAAGAIGYSAFGAVGGTAGAFCTQIYTSPVSLPIGTSTETSTGTPTGPSTATAGTK